MAEIAFLTKNIVLMGNLGAGLFLLKRNNPKKHHWDLRNEIMQKSPFQY